MFWFIHMSVIWFWLLCSHPNSFCVPWWRQECEPAMISTGCRIYHLRKFLAEALSLRNHWWAARGQPPQVVAQYHCIPIWLDRAYVAKQYSIYSHLVNFGNETMNISCEMEMTGSARVPKQVTVLCWGLLLARLNWKLKASQFSCLNTEDLRKGKWTMGLHRMKIKLVTVVACIPNNIFNIREHCTLSKHARIQEIAPATLITWIIFYKIIFFLVILYPQTQDRGVQK